MKKLKSRRRVWVKFLVALTIVIGAMAVVGQTCQPVIHVGHDDYMLMPISEWGFGSGYWDGFNAHTRQGTGGRIISYGIVWRSTNVYP